MLKFNDNSTGCEILAVISFLNTVETCMVRYDAGGCQLLMILIKKFEKRYRISSLSNEFLKGYINRTECNRTFTFREVALQLGSKNADWVANNQTIGQIFDFLEVLCFLVSLVDEKHRFLAWHRFQNLWNRGI